jgi:hypothetical protein
MKDAQPTTVPKEPLAANAPAPDVATMPPSARDLERRAIEPGAFVPRCYKSNHPNWEMFVIWSLVVVSFAALFFAGCVIWAKCHGQ